MIYKLYLNKAVKKTRWQDIEPFENSWKYKLKILTLS